MHKYDPGKVSTKNRTQYGQNIDVKSLREDTINFPDEVKALVDDASGFEVGTMRKSSQADGWAIREPNSRGTGYTGRYIQYHPGTHRHFNGKAYWKVSSPKYGLQRFLINP